MEADRVLLYTAGAVLNLSLAVLVGRVRPRRPGNGLLAAVFAINGVYASLIVLAEPFFPESTPGSQLLHRHVFSLVNLLSIIPLALLPFVVPWVRVGRRWRRTVVGVAGAFVALFFLSNTLDLLGLLPNKLHDVPWNEVVIHASAVVGTVLLLDATLSARGTLERRTAAMFLAAFALRVTCTGISSLGRPWLLWPPFYRSLDTWPWLLAADIAWQSLVYAALWMTALSIPVALLVNRLRGGTGAGSAWGDLAVVIMIPLGLTLGWGFGGFVFEYLIIRPVILSFAILQFQMLGIDVRRNEALIGTAVLVALLGVFLLVAGMAKGAGAAADGVALVVTLGVAGALAVPLLRILLLPSEADAPRRILVYRAALEAAQRESDPSASATLKALRRELGVSDKEHALLAQDIVAPSPDFVLVPGFLFLDRYRVVRPLGRGASGEVVLARDERLQREVAIKRLAGHVRRDALAVKAFEREMRLATTLQHPNIVAVHDVESIGDDAFLIMEYMPGGSLQERVEREGRLPEAAARRAMTDILDALAALHEKGIIHRDVKPSNVLFDATGRAKLADFTVARDVVSGETMGPSGGRPVGTWAFMSPEQARGVRATARSDLYGVSATLYAALTGRAPIELDSEDERAARMRIAREEPVLPLPDVSDAVNEALARGLAKSPAARFPDAARMGRALAG